MAPTFVLMLREGLEASLIVSILLAYLVTIDRRDQMRNVWFGVVTAIAASLAAGGLLFLTAREFEGRAEEIFEGIASLLAVGVLTWMVFWMRRHAVNIKRSLHEKVAEALRSPSRLALATMAFVVVVREGIETALFLFATVRQVGAGPGTVGSILGLTVAVVLGAGIYNGGVRLNLSLFFTLTGGFLLVVAAGLAAHGMHELIEAGIFPAGIEHVWRLGALPDDRGAGVFLKQLLGYNADPALTEVLLWAGYLLWVGVSFFRPILRVRRPQVAPERA